MVYWKTDPSPLWGQFATNYPTQTIQPQTTERAFVWTGRPNLPGGAEAKVWYTLDGDQNWAVGVYFNVTARPLADNEITVETTNSKKLMASYNTKLTNHTSESVKIAVLGGPR